MNSITFISHKLALELKMLVSEVDKMSIEEYHNWLEYYKIMDGKSSVSDSNQASSEEDNQQSVLDFLRSKKG